MDEKLPAPCDACRGSGLRHGAVCEECQVKGYRLFINGKQAPVQQQRPRRWQRPVQHRTLDLSAERLAASAAKLRDTWKGWGYRRAGGRPIPAMKARTGGLGSLGTARNLHAVVGRRATLSQPALTLE
jgi:hypothetical protein